MPLEFEVVFVDGFAIDRGHRIGRGEDGTLSGAGVLRVGAGAFLQVGNAEAIVAGDGGIAAAELDVDGVSAGLVGRAREGEFLIVALRAVGKRPGLGGAGELDGFDAHGIAFTDKDVAVDATRNGSWVLQQDVLVHVCESTIVGGFDAVARAQTAVFDGDSSRCCFRF